MDHSITILSEKEKAILESYMLSADGLAEFWGENCEVIIHDLTQLDASVVKIVNGHLSGRRWLCCTHGIFLPTPGRC